MDSRLREYHHRDSRYTSMSPFVFPGPLLIPGPLEPEHIGLV